MTRPTTPRPPTDPHDPRIASLGARRMSRRTPWRGLAALALAAPLLAACAGFRLPGMDEAPPPSDYSNLDPQVADLPGAGSAVVDPPLPRRRPQVPSDLTLSPPTAAPLDGVETVAEVATLVGLDFDQTASLLGEPTLQEIQPPAQIWSYNGPDCVLSIFFYPQVGGERYRALTYEVVEPASDAQSAQRCFTALVAEHRKPAPPPAPEGAGQAEDTRARAPGLSDAAGGPARVAARARNR